MKCKLPFRELFRLWRLDAQRHKIEDELKALFGGNVTRKEIGQLDPTKVYEVAVGKAPTKGPAQAAISIVEWSDFQ